MNAESESFTGLDTAHRGRLPRGGRGGGAIYHLHARNGSRRTGQSARAAAAYIQRTAEYSRDAEAELVYTESGHMPRWAEGEPGTYWEAADLHERANGRLFKRVEVALPLALSEAEQRALAVGFAHHLTDGEQLPYTLAIHAGAGSNPHCHLLISERGNDGLERAPEQWFRRYNAAAPEQGGARKSRALQPKAWLLGAREAWAEQANQALERAGLDVRIDHRSLAAQGIERLPSLHLGPTVAGMEARGIETTRGGEARRREQVNVERGRVTAELAQVNAELAELTTVQEDVTYERARPEPAREPGRAGVEREGRDVGGAVSGLGAGDLRDAGGRLGAERGEGRAAEPERSAGAGTGAPDVGAGDAESAHPPHGRRGPARGREREVGGPEREDGGPARAVVPEHEPGSVARGAGERGGERGGDAGRGVAVSDSRPGGPGERAADPGERAVERAVGGDDRSGEGGDSETRRRAAAVEQAAERARAQLAATRAARKAAREQLEATREARQQEERARERERGRDEDFELEP